MAEGDPVRPIAPGDQLVATVARPAAELARALGHDFAQPELLVEALTHPGALDGRPRRHDYERLEFLGDRVLGLLIAEWLLERHPDEREGGLGKRQAQLVSRAALAVAARRLELGRYLILAPGETAAREHDGLLADAMEAVIAALYLDDGLGPARALVRLMWRDQIDAVAETPRDPKTTLQEWTQARRAGLPDYRLVERVGPDHAPRFRVEARVPGHDAVIAEGGSKRLAEQAAAAALLAALERSRS